MTIPDTPIDEWLFNLPRFHDTFKALVFDSVSKQFPNLTRPNSPNASHNWNYLLLCSSILAQSRMSYCQDAALRIAQACLQENVSNQASCAAAIILDMLGNKPAIDVARRKMFLKGEVEGELPFSLLQDWTLRSLQNSIYLHNSESIAVNRFQKEFWATATENHWLSISAPTSSGKSFILNRWLIDQVQRSPKALVVYLVPTRALIHQVEHDLKQLVSAQGAEDINIFSFPSSNLLKSNLTNILVFTQERLLMFLNGSEPQEKISILVVDEAQKVSDGPRGVLLQHAIDLCRKQNSNCRVIFATPNTSNPEQLLVDAPTESKSRVVQRDDVMVNQNLLWVSQRVRKPDLWDVELVWKGTPSTIGTIQLKDSPDPESKRLPFVAFALASRSGGNILYVNGAADAEKVAAILYDLQGRSEEESSDLEIEQLAELIIKTIHKGYTLARVIRRRIAFHYGNMPLLVRTEIERLFSINKIRFLVCTSTLIEGVNLPCQSVFVRGPTRGRGKPLSAPDFWNLAGRAGRWGKEFQGNIVCVDARKRKVWHNAPPRQHEKTSISRASDRTLQDPLPLEEFVRSGTPRAAAAEDPTLEHMYSFLCSSQILWGDIRTAPWSHRCSAENLGILSMAVQDSLVALQVPNALVLKHAGISPIAMNNLLVAMLSNISNEKLNELFPPAIPPESDDAPAVYQAILVAIEEYLGGGFGVKKRCTQLAYLIVHWMRGFPLARIIQERERFYRDRSKLSNIIRDTLSDVEQFARFKAPKYLSCYCDLREAVLKKTGIKDSEDNRFDLRLFLEFGVSQTTHLSLIRLGLSRASAIEVGGIITDNNFDEAACLTWLKENDWMVSELPALVKREVSEMLALRR